MNKKLYALYANNGLSYEDNQIVLLGVFSNKLNLNNAKEVAQLAIKNHKDDWVNWSLEGVEIIEVNKLTLPYDLTK